MYHMYINLTLSPLQRTTFLVYKSISLYSYILILMYIIHIINSIFSTNYLMFKPIWDLLNWSNYDITSSLVSLVMFRCSTPMINRQTSGESATRNRPRCAECTNAEGLADCFHIVWNGLKLFILQYVHCDNCNQPTFD
jgi:hypothetical protein